jgi:MFS family permease
MNEEDSANVTGGPWSPLRIAMYRSLWIAALVSNVGTFMHIVAAGWAMTSLTDSPTLVGLVQTSWAVPGFALALHAGAFADMVERRRLIALTQVLALAIAAGLGVLEMTGNLGVTTLLVGTFLESVALTIAAPAFMALTPQLVGTQYLSQAFGLDSVSRNIAQSVGPALAGAVIAFTNPGAVFVLNAVSFVGILIVVRKLPKFTVQVESASKINHVIKDGIRHVVRTAQLRNIALRLALVLGATASLNSVMPVVAKESLNVGSSGFGILAGALGVGSVLAVWLLPILRKKLNAELLAGSCDHCMGYGNCWVCSINIAAHRGSCAVAMWSNTHGAHECVVLHIYCTIARSFTRTWFIHRHAHGVARHVCWSIRMGIHRIIYFGSCGPHCLLLR